MCVGKSIFWNNVGVDICVSPGVKRDSVGDTREDTKQAYACVGRGIPNRRIAGVRRHVLFEIRGVVWPISPVYCGRFLSTFLLDSVGDGARDAVSLG